MRFKQALKIRNPKNRLKRIYEACKSKRKCAGGDEIDMQNQQDSEEPLKKSRGGCGAQQPNITIDGMKMVAEYKAPKKKNEDQEQLPEPVERKQVLSAERVCFFFHLYCVILQKKIPTELHFLLGSECFEAYQ